MFEKKASGGGGLETLQAGVQKYYARVMKGNMSREDFNAWVAFAAGRRDTTLLLLEGTSSAEGKARLIVRLREELNKT